MDVGGAGDLAAVLAADYGLDLAEAPLLLADSGGVRVWQVTATGGQWVARLYLPGGPTPARLWADMTLHAGLRERGVAAPEALPGRDGHDIQWLGHPDALPALVVTRGEQLRPMKMLPDDERQALQACGDLGRATARLHVAASDAVLAPLFPRLPASRDPVWALLTPASLHGGLAAGQRLWLPDGRLYWHDLTGRARGTGGVRSGRRGFVVRPCDGRRRALVRVAPPGSGRVGRLHLNPPPDAAGSAGALAADPCTAPDFTAIPPRSTPWPAGSCCEPASPMSWPMSHLSLPNVVNQADFGA